MYHWVSLSHITALFVFYFVEINVHYYKVLNSYVFPQAIVASPQYPAFLEHAMKIFIKILSEGDPLFISEYNIQVNSTSSYLLNCSDPPEAEKPQKIIHIPAEHFFKTLVEFYLSCFTGNMGTKFIIIDQL